MFGGGPDLDAHTAQYQTRDLLRDAPLRMGAYTMFVAFFISFVGTKYIELNVHWLILVGGSIILGILVSVLATRWANGKDATRVAQEQVDRSRRKQAELDTFLKDQDK